MRTAAISVLAFAIPLAARVHAAEDMKTVGRVVVEDGVIHEGFAFDDAGGKLGYAETGGKGRARLHVGPPGGAGWTADITSFSPAPERIVFVGGSWFVVSNEGSRRAALVGANGHIKREIGPFGDCFVSSARGK